MLQHALVDRISLGLERCGEAAAADGVEEPQDALKLRLGVRAAGGAKMQPADRY